MLCFVIINERLKTDEVGRPLERRFAAVADVHKDGSMQVLFKRPSPIGDKVSENEVKMKLRKMRGYVNLANKHL